MSKQPPGRTGSDVALALVPTRCCVCGTTDAEPVGVGEDFEYRTSPDTFLAVQCRTCKLVYLDPRPATSEFDRIYPDDYHAFAFTPDRFGFVYKVRRKLEARRLLSLCKGLPPDALITDVGCGDGFHLELLREFGPASWRLEGIDLDERAAKGAAERSLTIHIGDVRTLDLPSESVDLALMIHTIEHVEDPAGMLRGVQRLLKPGGRLLVLTDNTDSLDFRLFRSRHWGGYHFPRHWNLFNADNLTRLARASGLEVDTMGTAVSPVNWLYSVRNTADDLGAPRRLVDWLGLESTVPLAAFTAFDTVHKLAGRGALLRAVLRRPT